ncbi:hypothetical protein LshimejAT787_1005270 [Lyophyllum shimeji]|uniref:Uncharacterized protein n=1 Tax=Lyophyllum shimeji TaxID=47721 RepID=A0A9P3PVA2_LYOSH|nr:hypothetical protein LshimejAT787_1005270 [Lyophyllum shimeji]
MPRWHAHPKSLVVSSNHRRVNLWTTGHADQERSIVVPQLNRRVLESATLRGHIIHPYRMPNHCSSASACPDNAHVPSSSSHSETLIRISQTIYFM